MGNGFFDLAGKVAVVTGGNGGIGLGIAVGLAQAGANIVVAARNEEKTKEALQQIQQTGSEGLGLTTDVTDEDSVASMIDETVKKFGRLDILVNNAGIGISRNPQDYTYEEWRKVIDVNLNGIFLCSRAVYPCMVQAGGGKVINIGSMTSIFGNARVMPYSASKGGVVQLTKSLAIAWAKDNIQVNAILPGWIDTDLTHALRTQPHLKEHHDLINARIPQGRWGGPEDMAGSAIFLASYASDYVTGVALPVDGGYSVF